MGNVVMEATQINYRRDDILKTVDQKLQELSQESAIDTDIAPVFKSNITYHPGDMVYYRNKLYVFTEEHTGAWAAGDVTATDVSTAMNTALAGKADYADIAGAFSAETAYTAGDLVIYNGIIYRCTNDHTGEWDADDFFATTIGAELNAINSNLTSVEKKDKVFVFSQNAVSSVLSFTGEAESRALLAQIIIVGQSGVTSTVNVATSGSGSVDLATTVMHVSSNDYQITSSGNADGKVNIDAGDLLGGWGNIYVRSFNHSMDNANVSITYS